jgi:hypothetical protein
MIAIIVLIVLLVITAGAAGIFYLRSNSPSGQTANTTTPTTVATNTSGTTPTTAPTTSQTPDATPTTAPTVPSSSNNYSALQPGPGCDKNGGTWNPQGLGSITCGTQITVSTSDTRGYLYFQLPNNKAFSANNKIGVIGDPSSSYECLGLEEQDANSGFLVGYCGDGHWSIYSISPTDGSIVQTLDKNLTSTRDKVNISLSLKGSTLSLSIDSEVHEVSITPIQPTKVAITYNSRYTSDSITVNNFSYTVLPS